jgi:hypothetical protein
MVKICNPRESSAIQIKQPTTCNNFSRVFILRLSTAQLVSGVLTPIIKSLTIAVAASGFTVGAWW